MAPDVSGCDVCVVAEEIELTPKTVRIHLVNEGKYPSGDFYVDAFINPEKPIRCGQLSNHYGWVQQIPAGQTATVTIELGDTDEVVLLQVIVDSTELDYSCEEADKIASFVAP